MSNTVEMKTYIIDCEKMPEREAAHEYLKGLFGFPEYYGGNLDALYDCLTDLPECVIRLEHPWALSKMGRYSGQILAVFSDAAKKGRIKLSD